MTELRGSCTLVILPKCEDTVTNCYVRMQQYNLIEMNCDTIFSWDRASIEL